MSFKINPKNCTWFWRSMGYALEANRDKIGYDISDRRWAQLYEDTFGIKTDLESGDIEFPSESEAVMFILKWS